MAILRIENLTKDYVTGFTGKKFRALSNLNLEVEEGEIFGFLGPNGAGKTTTIKILLRIIFPTSGTAWIMDKKIGEAEQHKIGYMPENPYFYRFLTGREFLRFYARLANLPIEDAKKKAERLLDIVGLGFAAKTRLSEYSKGMVTRVGLAQALITDPTLLLLDEPMSGLDPIGRREIRDLIASLKEEKKTIFFCSHILADIEMLCDRVAILNKGELIKLGTVREMLSSGQSNYVLSLDKVPPETALQMKQSAAKYEEIGGIIHLTIPDRETAQKMAESAISAGATIQEFRPDRGTLEDYFVREVGAK
ncbi:MAG: ABC transporter ATP-binding protein [Candidatus Omnitrophota bacterium]|jgi:ABC-2 type transport system ATP-binding protein|nr:MAG: ABC transporter ATP-binding protein [Candidatus Omnitrophota bacterium]